jgi:hypothetical protein
LLLAHAAKFRPGANEQTALRHRNRRAQLIVVRIAHVSNVQQFELVRRRHDEHRA